MNKLKSCILALGLLVVITSNVFATNIEDNYIGAGDHIFRDVIGEETDFDISSMDVELIGNTLFVDIHTGFGGKGHERMFDDFTDDDNGIGYGDLFLSGDWDPDGIAGNKYVDDNHSNGTTWTYGVALDNTWGTGGGTASLYELSGTNNDSAILTDDLFSSGSRTYRNGQEVLVDEDIDNIYTTKLNEKSSWSTETGLVHFEVDLTGTSLLNGSEIALHWGMTCANDTIEGALPTPEPGTVALLSIGLIGLAGGAARKRIKKSPK